MKAKVDTQTIEEKITSLLTNLSETPPLEQVFQIAQFILNFINFDSARKKLIVDCSYEEAIDLYGLFISSVHNTKDQNILDAFPTKNLGGDRLSDLKSIYDVCHKAQDTIPSLLDIYGTQDMLNSSINKYSTLLGNVYHYQLTDGDISRIQKLINEIREELTSSKLIPEDHKHRLLKRLEKLQVELHKQMSDFDRFWGLFVESGTMIGRFGREVKPIVDRFRELADIFWRSQARAEELPSNSPLPIETKPPEEEEK